jgi:hypothetical protein
VAGGIYEVDPTIPATMESVDGFVLVNGPKTSPRPKAPKLRWETDCPDEEKEL